MWPNSYEIVESHAHTNKINNDRDVIIQSTQTTHTIQILCAAATVMVAATAAATDANSLTALSGCVWSEC